MHIYDQIVFTLYLLGMVGVAAVFYRRNKDLNQMFAAGGRSPWWVSGLSSYMTLFSAGTFVVWGGLAYRLGTVAITINVVSGIAALIVGFFVAAKWKEMNISTPAEYIRLRFGPFTMQYYSWMLMPIKVFSSAVALYALAAILQPLIFSESPGYSSGTDDFYSMGSIIIILGTIIVVYTIIGGLWAVLMTDVLQFFILSVSIVFILVVAIGYVGGLPSFIEAAPINFFDFSNTEFTWYFFLGWGAIHFFSTGAEWAYVQRYIAVPSKAHARKAGLLFGILYIISPTIWLLPAMIYRVIDPDANPEQAYILMSTLILPAGMVGLVAAAMFSATASMMSSQINVFAGVMTEDFYRPLLRPNKSEIEYLWAGRMATALIGGAIILIAVAIPAMGGAEKVVFSVMSLFITPLFAPALWCIFSKRVGTEAVFITAATTASAGLILKFGLASREKFGDSSFLGPIAEWVSHNTRHVDILVGVVTPVVVLFLLEIYARATNKTSPGWERLRARIARSSDSAAAAAADEIVPITIVLTAVASCAAIMFVLALLNQENVAGLYIMSAILVAFSGLLILVLRSKRRKESAM